MGAFLQSNFIHTVQSAIRCYCDLLLLQRSINQPGGSSLMASCDHCGRCVHTVPRIGLLRTMRPPPRNSRIQSLHAAEHACGPWCGRLGRPQASLLVGGQFYRNVATWIDIAPARGGDILRPVYRVNVVLRVHINGGRCVQNEVVTIEHSCCSVNG
jgi:hypothetical protein